MPPSHVIVQAYWQGTKEEGVQVVVMATPNGPTPYMVQLKDYDSGEWFPTMRGFMNVSGAQNYALKLAGGTK